MKRSSWVLAVVAATLVVLIAWFLFFPRASLPTNPLASVPEDAVLVLRMRADKLVRSEAFRRLVVERGQARGFARIERVCGFHPLHGIESLVVFAEPGAKPERPKVAAVARGKLDHARLIDCVGKLGRGGLSALVREKIHGVDTVRNRKGTARAAFVGRDGILAGDADAVGVALTALFGGAASAERSALGPLYRALPETSDVALVADFRGHEALLSSLLATLRVDQLITPKGIATLAASGELGPDRLRGAATVTMQSDALAEALARAITEARGRLLDLPALSLTGFAAPLRRLEVKRDGAQLTLRGDIRLKVAEAALELLPLLQSLRAQPAVQPRTVPADAGSDAGAAR